MANWFTEKLDQASEFVGDVTQKIGTEILKTNDFIDILQEQHADKVDAIFDTELSEVDREALFKSYLQDPSFRDSIVRGFQEEPEEFKELVSTLSKEDPEFLKLENALNNDFVMEVVANNPAILKEMLDPQNMDDPKAVLLKHAENKEVLRSIVNAEDKYPEAYTDFRTQLNQEITDLKSSTDAGDVAIANDLENGLRKFDNAGGMDTLEKTVTVADQQDISVMNAGLQVVAGYKIEALVDTAKTDPTKAGVDFTNTIADFVGGNALTQANVAELQANPELMKAIGEDLAKNGATLKASLPKLMEQDPQAIAQFMDKHPEMLDVAVPIIASVDPMQAANMAMEGMHSQLLNNVGGYKEAVADVKPENLEALENAVSKADLENIPGIDMEKLSDGAVDSILETNSIVSGLQGSSGFMGGLGERLANPTQAANLMNNLDLTEGVVGGDLTALKVVADSLKDDPEGGLDILASEHFMGLAAERWGTDIMDANIDGFFTDMKTALADFATSETGLMLKQQFGIDLSQMAGSLDGFAGMIKEQITPMISSMGADVANLQMGGGIVASINEKLEPHGGSIGMNSAGGDLSGIVGGAQSHLANTQQYAANVEYAREMGLSGQELQDYIDDQVEDRFERELPMEKVVDATSGQVRERTPTELASAQNIENDHDAILAKSKLPGNEPGLDPVLAGG